MSKDLKINKTSSALSVSLGETAASTTENKAICDLPAHFQVNSTLAPAMKDFVVSEETVQASTDRNFKIKKGASGFQEVGYQVNPSVSISITSAGVSSSLYYRDFQISSWPSIITGVSEPTCMYCRISNASSSCGVFGNTAVSTTSLGTVRVVRPNSGSSASSFEEIYYIGYGK